MDSILHRDITSFTVHVSDCDLEKSFSFDTTVEITDDVRLPIHVKAYRS